MEAAIGRDDQARTLWNPRQNRLDEDAVQAFARRPRGEWVGEGVVDRRLVLTHQQFNLCRRRQVSLVHDQDMFRRFVRVVHLVDSPAALLNPVVFRRLAKYSRQDPRRERRRAAQSPR